MSSFLKLITEIPEINLNITSFYGTGIVYTGSQSNMVIIAVYFGINIFFIVFYCLLQLVFFKEFALTNLKGCKKMGLL
jgi:hypothetical protein